MSQIAETPGVRLAGDDAAMCENAFAAVCGIGSLLAAIALFALASIMTGGTVSGDVASLHASAPVLAENWPFP